jgi:hypothetical protein
LLPSGRRPRNKEPRRKGRSVTHGIRTLTVIKHGKSRNLWDIPRKVTLRKSFS